MRTRIAAIRGALAVGTILTLAHERSGLLSFAWFPALRGLPETEPLPGRGHLPDALWAYAATLLVSLAWTRAEHPAEGRAWMLLPFFVGLSSELA